MKIARRHSMTPDIEPERWAFINFVPPGAPSAASTADGSIANGRDLGGVSPLPSLSSRPADPSPAVDGTGSPNTDALGCGPGTQVERAARSAQNGG